MQVISLSTKRKFLPQDFVITDWDSILPYFNELLNFEINSISDLETWLMYRSELESILDEDGRWRYIKMTCNTNDKQLSDAYQFFVTELRPHLINQTKLLNDKFVSNKYARKLDKNKYFTILQMLKEAMSLHEEENIDNITKLILKEQEYQSITSNFTIEYNGNNYTLPKANVFLQSQDRAERECVYKLIKNRKKQDQEKLDILFNEMLEIRNNMALKVGYSNYRDYRFVELGRNEYTTYDCNQFHISIKKHVLPLYDKLLQKKKRDLNLDVLKPWDVEIMSANSTPLAPFKDANELVDKSIELFYKIDSYFGDALFTMKKLGNLDLESRAGKAPGGYNMSLPETGVPFIFMNAAGTIRDLITMVHEGGHAVHSFLSNHLELKGFKEIPIEIAELASMSMELFSLENWSNFFKDESEIKQAKYFLLQRIISILPWVATVDKFQHWIYTHPSHTISERNEKWIEIFNEFSPETIDYTGLEDSHIVRWQNQLHIFEVPFYYIEYGISQLGALAMWMQYKKNPSLAIANYKNALSLGNTIQLKDLYAEAGINFNFSEDYISELMQFVQAEIESL